MSEKLKMMLDAARDIATVEEIRAAAEKIDVQATRVKCNSHIHLPPNFSAFDRVSQAVELAAAQNIGVVGVSNYYDYEVYAEFVDLARRAGIFPLFGLEIICLVDDLVRSGVRVNDPGNPGKFYICGKGITRFADMTPRAAALNARIRRADDERMEEMTRRIENVFASRGAALGLTALGVLDMVARRHKAPRGSITLQERHVAQSCQETFFAQTPAAARAEALERVFGASTSVDVANAVAVQNELRSRLMKAGKPAFVDETFVTFGEAKELILELGGIPCYPTLADGASPVCEFEATPERLVENLRERGIHAAEFIPIRNRPEILVDYARAMRRAGMAVTGGTEHNTLDLIPIEPFCLGGAEVPEEAREIFWEGACVVAAHQFLTLHGEAGFVTPTGEPNPAFSDAEERIASFARLGAAVIERGRAV